MDGFDDDIAELEALFETDAIQTDTVRDQRNHVHRVNEFIAAEARGANTASTWNAPNPFIQQTVKNNYIDRERTAYAARKESADIQRSLAQVEELFGTRGFDFKPRAAIDEFTQEAEAIAKLMGQSTQTVLNGRRVIDSRTGQGPSIALLARDPSKTKSAIYNNYLTTTKRCIFCGQDFIPVYRSNCTVLDRRPVYGIADSSRPLIDFAEHCSELDYNPRNSRCYGAILEHVTHLTPQNIPKRKRVKQYERQTMLEKNISGAVCTAYPLSYVFSVDDGMGRDFKSLESSSSGVLATTPVNLKYAEWHYTVHSYQQFTTHKFIEPPETIRALFSRVDGGLLNLHQVYEASLSSWLSLDEPWGQTTVLPMHEVNSIDVLQNIVQVNPDVYFIPFVVVCRLSLHQ